MGKSQLAITSLQFGGKMFNQSRMTLQPNKYIITYRELVFTGMAGADYEYKHVRVSEEDLRGALDKLAKDPELYQEVKVYQQIFGDL